MTTMGLKTLFIFSTVGVAGIAADPVAAGTALGTATPAVILGVISVLSASAMVWQYRERNKAHADQIKAIRAAHEREMSNTLAVAKVVDANTSVMSKVEGAISRCNAAQAQARREDDGR